VLNAPSTEEDDRQAIPENRNCAACVWTGDIVGTRWRESAVWFKTRSLSRLQEEDEAGANYP
jgi:hypothetical protein